MPSIESLPNEIVYRIFDSIDVRSIIYFSYTCKRFYDCRRSYNSYKLNFKSIAKKDFDLICRIIDPSNIISIELFDDDRTPGQIKSFIKEFPISKLNRLKSLSLVKINENDLPSILKHFLNQPLNHLRIEYRQYFQILHESTKSVLKTILSCESLRIVYLDMQSYDNDYVNWPQSSHIRHLTLINSNMNQLFQIIIKSHQFRSIILKKFTMKQSNDASLTKDHFKTLSVFKIEESELIMDKVQYFISLMPELVHLKLEGNAYMPDQLFQNDQLEEHFRTKLIHLKTFQCCIRFSATFLKRNNITVETFIKQFQNEYWTSSLNCFINCDVINNSNEIHLYSIPCIYHQFKYSDIFDIISVSTLASANCFNQRFDFVYEMELNLKDLEVAAPLQMKQSEHKLRLFRNLHTLKLTVNDQCSQNCFSLLLKFIHLEQIEKLILVICSRGNYLSLMLKNFLIFLEYLPKLHSIEIFNRWHGIFSFIDINYFCSLIPSNIKHLDVDIFDIEDIKILISRLHQISSFKFKFSFDKSLYIKHIFEWLSNRRIDSTHILDIHYVSIWISQKVIETQSKTKRIKLMD